MKQTAIMICTCIIFFVLGFLTFGFYVKHVINEGKTRQQISGEKYIYMGKKYIDDIPFKKHRENGFIPSETIYQLPQGAIPDAKTAAKIGFAILSAIYGEETIKREIPFQITLLNNKEWCLDGTLPKNMTGGTAFIIIQKSDGRSLNYGHYK